MNNEIKRLLKLSTIPGFNLTKEEEKTLKDWKKKQKSATAPAKKKVKAPKGYKVDDGIGSTDKGESVVPASDSPEAAEERKLEQDTSNDVKDFKNVVKTEDKELGRIKEES